MSQLSRRKGGKFILEQWRKASQGNECYVVGDLNLDHMKWDTPEFRHKAMIEQTKLMIETEGFFQLVEGHTRAWKNQDDSCLDHIWSKNPEKILQIRNVVRASSDHNVVEVSIRVRGKVGESQEVLKRKRKKFDDQRFKDSVARIEWKEMYDKDDLDEAYEVFEKKVQQCIEDEAPMKVVQPRKNYKDWMDDETREMINERDTAREKARTSKLDEDWNQFKTIRNRCTLAVRKRKKKHLAGIYIEIEKNNDSKSLYNMTKSHLGWKSGGPPQSFLIDGKKISAPQQMAQEQLKYFNKKVEKLLEDLPPKTDDPLATLKQRMDKFGDPASRKKLTFKKITEIDTLRLISKLGNSTAFGADLIDSKSIKLAVLHLYKPIMHLINMSISQNKFASRWKIARIIPLHKGKGADRMNTKSYRPISLLGPVSKLAEKALQEQLLAFLEETNQLNLNLHAYRKDLTTTTAMIQMSDTILEATDKNLITALVTVDESAAFDCVSKEILLQKLQIYNLDTKALQWIRSYLSERSQFVQIGAKISETTPVDRGVPQGSVLGPILYSVYTNELPEVIVDIDCLDNTHKMDGKLFSDNCSNCGSLPSFADDATYVISKKTRQELQEKIDVNMDKIKKFLNNNDLTVNDTKTKLLEIMVKQKRNKVKGTQPIITTTDEKGDPLIIKPGMSLRILGGNFHRNLSWTGHIEVGESALLPALRKRLGALKHLSKGIPKKCRLILANGAHNEQNYISPTPLGRDI